MSRKFLTNLDMVQNELQNPKMHNLGAAPGTPVKGQVYMNTSDNTLYWWDGTVWQSAKGGAASFPGYGAVAPEPTFGSASADGVGTTVSRADHKHGNPLHDAAAHSAIPLSALAPAAGIVDMNFQRLVNLTAPTTGGDAANKTYVDSVASGLDPKQSVRLLAANNITLPGPQTVDGVSAVAGDRVLCINQTGAPANSGNGIYIVTGSGAWTRATDADTWPELVSAFVFVEEGNTYKDTGWVCTADQGGTINTTPNVWTQFSGPGTIIAGSGLAQATNTFNVGAANGSILVGADDIQVAYGGTGAAVTAARSDHNHDTAYPPLARTISTTAPLTGGGDLTANRTLAITSFAGAAAGAVPVSVGGTVNFLRADGTWAAPALDTTAGDARYTRRFAIDVGGSTSQVVSHGLGSLDVLVQVYRKASPFDQIECDVEHTSTTTCTLRFAVAPAAAEYRAVVVG